MAEQEQYAQPSRNPANDDSLVGVLRQVLDKFLLGVDDMLPAQVIAFDRNSNRAQVKPLIKLLTTEGQEVERPQIASVPVFQIGGGGMMLNFNLKPGDLGWIKANDRDISLSMQSGGEAKPNSFRKHSFEDGVFFPDAMRNFVIQGEDAENAVLQTMDGNVRVAIWPDRVKTTVGSSESIVKADEIMHKAGGSAITIKAGEITLDAAVVKMTGIFQQGGSGGSTMAGSLTTSGDFVSKGIILATHTHKGVQPGSGNTGEPQ